MAALTRLRREDDGFSLMELLASMLIGSIVLTALMVVFTTSMQHSNETSERVEGMQRARVVVDRATTLLNSETCLQTVSNGSETFVEPLVAGSTGNSVTFYADLRGASDTPDRYTLTYDPAAHTFTESVIRGNGVFPNVTFTGTPTTKVSTSIYPARIDSAVQPIFRYYAFDTMTGLPASSPLALGSTGLTAAQAASVVKVVVSAAAAGDHSANLPDTSATAISGESIVATSDPTTDSSQATPTVCPRS